MQQILNYIIKNSIRMLFLLLLGISLLLTIQSHSYHRSKVINSANGITGGVYEQIHSFYEFMNLKSENEGLAAENALLKSILYNQTDSINKFDQDPLNIENDYVVIQSKIIKNSYSIHENFLTINSGKAKGVKPFMAVVNSKGIVGIVDITSKNYATVVSVLNTKSKINAKIKKSNHFGTLTWNGKNTGFVQLIDIPRLASVKRGDTIVTGAQSVFPENISIGTIYKIYIDKESNLFTMDVKLFNDMTSLGHVYVIENKNREELEALEAQIKDE